MGPLYFLTLVLLQYYQTYSVFLTSIGNAKFNFAAYQHAAKRREGIATLTFTGAVRDGQDQCHCPMRISRTTPLLFQRCI